MSFDEAEYARLRGTVTESAAALVPRLMLRFNPTSMVDVGCGEGWFARAFASWGCDASGYDISVATPHTVSLGPTQARFRHFDLTESRVGSVGPVDLALCIEVAEHIPDERAAYLVGLLAQSAPIVVFSAAAPGQGGFGHVNEQPPSYWAALFAEHGYEFSEDIRTEIHDDARIAWWYRQNLFIAATPETLATHGLARVDDPEPATW